MHLHRISFFSVVAALVLASQGGPAQQTQKTSAVAPAPHAKQTHLRHVLVVGESRGYEHDSISAAMNAIYEMGKQTGLWDTMIRTDTELITKKDLGRNSKNLNYFDVLVFASTTGELDDGCQSKTRHDVLHQGRWKGLCWNPCSAGHELQLAGIRGDDWRVVRSASMDDVQCSDHQ